LNADAADRDTEAQLEPGIVPGAASVDRERARCGRRAADMRIGDPVTYRGRRYVLRGLDPMGVPNRRADLEDCETGELIRAPVAALEPA